MQCCTLRDNFIQYLGTEKVAKIYSLLYFPFQLIKTHLLIHPQNLHPNPSSPCPFSLLTWHSTISSQPPQTRTSHRPTPTSTTSAHRPSPCALYPRDLNQGSRWLGHASLAWACGSRSPKPSMLGLELASYVVEFGHGDQFKVARPQFGLELARQPLPTRLAMPPDEQRQRTPWRVSIGPVGVSLWSGRWER